MWKRKWVELDRRLATDLLLGGLAAAGVWAWLVSGWAVLNPARGSIPAALSRIEVEQDLDFVESGDNWRFRVTHEWRSNALQPAVLTVFRNQLRVHQQAADSGGGLAGIEVAETNLPEGQRLICALEFPGAGHPYARHLFLIRNHQLVPAAKIGGEHGGPELKDLDHDGKPEWVFDNFDWYVHNTDGPDRLQVFKQTSSGKLRLWKSLANPKRRHLTDSFEFHNL